MGKNDESRIIIMMHLSTRNRQIEQAKQSDLPKKILKGRLPKTSRSTLNPSTNMLDLIQECK